MKTVERDDVTGAYREPAELDASGWRTLVTATNEIGRQIAQDYGVRLQFHPHADSYVMTQPQVERFLTDTDPEYVSLCLDTGHLAYGRADCTAIISRFPDRIGYVHIKQMDPAILAKAEAEDLAFGQAVAMGASCEPPSGLPDLPADPGRPGGTRHGTVHRGGAGHVPVRLQQAEADRGTDLPLSERQWPGRYGMTVRVGVIGTGMIGEDHVRRLTTVVAGAAVTAVTDVDKDRAAAVAERFGGPTVHASGEDVIADPGVDGVVVASWGPTHEEYVLASIEAGKPVFCEKPLATTPEACSRIIDAEIAAGRRLVQVGFMRRYDAGYRALKAVAADGSIGMPLLAHMAHRNPSVPPTVTSEMAINDSVVHEIDVTRWLLDEEITAVMIMSPKRSRKAAEGLQDPMIVVFRTASGVLVDDELSVNVRYGYDIQAEIVGETGNARLANAGAITVTSDRGRAAAVPADWRERFAGAYDEEFRAWIDDVGAGREASGPSSWDGYAAAVVADACISALHSFRGRLDQRAAPGPARLLRGGVMRSHWTRTCCAGCR